MKSNISFIFIYVFMLNVAPFNAQNYDNLKVKEQYDLFNWEEANRWHMCSSSPDLCTLGDGYAQLLDGYITMYKTTKDKAYLYKFWLETLCLISRRPNFGSLSYPLWCDGADGSEYHNGHTIAALARFVYLIKEEEISLQSVPVYPFPEITTYPYNYNGGNGPQPYSNFYYFADWVGLKVDEVIERYRGRNKLNITKGLLFNVSEENPEAMNKQSGFAKALLYQGYTASNTYFYTPAARNIASDYFNQINFVDKCDDNRSYNQQVLRENTTYGAYWWYHQGWGYLTRDCFYQNQIKYEHYTEFVEDMSHGAHDISFAINFYKMQTKLTQRFGYLYAPGNFDLFSLPDMIKFKNTFTKLLYDGNGQFYNAVNKSDTKVSYNNKFNNYPPHNEFAMNSMCYMPLEEYDDGDGPSVYDIVMKYYADNIAPQTSKPGSYGGFHNKGHADVVAAQWRRGCPNLELYNRNVVYDQDFFAKNNLIITPGTSNNSSGESYAEPKLTTPEFIVRSGVTVNMTAGESITLKPGVQIKSGSTYRGYITTSNCTNGQRQAGENIHEEQTNSGSDQTTSEKPVSDVAIKTQAVPNPFTNSTSIQFTLNKASTVSVKIIDSFGRMVYELKNNENYNPGFNEVIISTEGLANGLYSCLITIDNKEIHTINLIKQ